MIIEAIKKGDGYYIPIKGEKEKIRLKIEFIDEEKKLNFQMIHSSSYFTCKTKALSKRFGIKAGSGKNIQ